MYSVFWLMVAASALVFLIHNPYTPTLHDLPNLFNDEPEGFVERRPDLAVARNAEESYQLRTLRTAITYSTQHNDGMFCELFEITYRGKPGPMLELEDGRPTRFGTRSSKDKTYFLPAEIRDVSLFAQHVRVCINNFCASV